MSDENLDPDLYRRCEQEHHTVNADDARVIFSFHDEWTEAEFGEDVVTRDVVLKRVPTTDSASNAPKAYRVIVRSPGEFSEMRRTDSEKYKLDTALTPDSEDQQRERITTMLNRSLPVLENAAAMMTETIVQRIHEDLDADAEWSIEA